MKHHLCTVKGCIFYGKYCRIHLDGSIKEAKPIKQFSKKREAVQRKEYRPLVSEVLKEHPHCKVKSPVCTGMAEGLHHLQGREGDNLTDKRLVIPACNMCQLFIEENSLWARNNGFKISRHANYKRVK